MTEVTKVVGYVRVSTDKQDLSFEAQQARLKAMAVVKDWDLAEVVVDRDEYSGDMDRPGLQRVIEMVKARQVGAVMVTSLDRMTRSTRDAVWLIELFNRKKVTMVSLREHLDTKTPMGRFFVRMIVSMAELERETIGSRTREGMGHLKRLGMPVGTAPYGWRMPERSNKLVPLAEKLPLVEDAAEQAVLSQIRALRAEGMRLREITESLNASGYKTRRGTEWRFQYVARLAGAPGR